MLLKRLGIAMAALLGVGPTEVALMAYQLPAGEQRTPAAPKRDTVRLSADASMIYKYVKMRKPGELNWQRIPWLVDLPEAMRQAKTENRPILIWASGDDPLEKC